METILVVGAICTINVVIVCCTLLKYKRIENTAMLEMNAVSNDRILKQQKNEERY